MIYANININTHTIVWNIITIIVISIVNSINSIYINNNHKLREICNSTHILKLIYISNISMEHNILKYNEYYITNITMYNISNILILSYVIYMCIDIIIVC